VCRGGPLLWVGWGSLPISLSLGFYLGLPSRCFVSSCGSGFWGFERFVCCLEKVVSWQEEEEKKRARTRCRRKQDPGPFTPTKKKVFCHLKRKRVVLVTGSNQRSPPEFG